MIISENSQLGLRFRNEDVKVAYLKCMVSFVKTRLSSFNDALKFAEGISEKNGGEPVSVEQAQEIAEEIGALEQYEILMDSGREEQRKIINKVGDLIHTTDLDFIKDDDSKYFLICDSVYKAAELIRIGENFTSRTLKDIKFGKYTYLMGKHTMIRFICAQGAIQGIYYDDLKNNAFEFGLEMEHGKYYFPKDCQKEFSQMMQVLTFVELGDIEIVTLARNTNNGGEKGKDKVHNASRNTVYVVDSSWNKLIIRTDGFAVRGHFRLQPCGVNHMDRKLMWINAFEKHGYTRRPRAEIVR